jgi:hypothetical protein
MFGEFSTASDLICGLQVAKKVHPETPKTLKVKKSTFDKVLGKLIRSNPTPRNAK